MVASGTILHAEDDENDAFLFRRALLKAGVTNPLVQVSDAIHAIRYLTATGAFSDRSKHPFPVLLITDLKMPGITGFDLLAQIKDLADCRNLRILVLTASMADGDKRRCFELGAHGYFVKPSTLAELVLLAAELRTSWIPPEPKPCPT